MALALLVAAVVAIGVAGPATADPAPTSIAAGLVCSTFDGTDATAAAVTASITGLDPAASYGVFVTPNGGPDDVALNNEPSAADSYGTLNLTEIEYADSWLPGVATPWVVQNAQNGEIVASGTLTVAGCPATTAVSANIKAGVVCATYDGTEATGLAEVATASGLTPNARYQAAVLPNGNNGNTALNGNPVTADGTGRLQVELTRHADSYVAGVDANWVIQNVSTGAVAATGLVNVTGCSVHSVPPKFGGMFGTVVVTGPVDPGVVVAPNGTRRVRLTGANGVPSRVSSVLLRVTASEAGAAGSVLVAGTPGLRFSAGQPATALVLARVDAGGGVVLKNLSGGSTRLSAQPVGYYAYGRSTRPGAFTAMSPRAVFGVHSPAAHTTTATVPGVPTDAAAALLEVTVTGAQRSGGLVAWAAGTARPAASNLSFTAGRTVTGLVLAPLTAGRVSVFNGSTGVATVTATVVGYYAGGAARDIGALQPVRATRVLDTRGGDGISPLGTLSFKMTGVPAGTAAVVLNLTTPAPAESTSLTVFAAHTDRPAATSLALTKGVLSSGLVVVPVGSDGTVTVASDSDFPVTLIADLDGFIS